MDVSDSEISEDEIDIQHRRSLGPVLRHKSMKMGHNWMCEEGLLATYAHVLEEDLHNLESFISSEHLALFGGSVHEYKTRRIHERRESSERLMALKQRYAQSKAHLKENQSHTTSQYPTEVQGLKYFNKVDASKDDILKQKLIVQGLLVRPEVLHRSALRSQSVGDIYNKSPAQSTWDGTVYKNTLIQSLNVKLQYKLYFEALRHHAVSIRNARLAVQPIVEKRLKKLIRIIFYAIMCDFLDHRRQVSRGHVKANLMILQKFLYPAYQVIHDNRNENKTQRASEERGKKNYERYLRRIGTSRLNRHNRLRLFFQHSMHLVMYFRVTRSKRGAVQRLKSNRCCRTRVQRAHNKTSDHLMKKHTSVAMSEFFKHYKGKRHVRKCFRSGDHFRTFRIREKAMSVWRSWVSLNKRKKKHIKSAVEREHKHFVASYEVFQKRNKSSAYMRLCQENADWFYYQNSLFQGLEALKSCKKHSQHLSTEKAKDLRRQRHLAESMYSFKRKILLQHFEDQGLQRGQMFFKSNKGMEALDVISHRRVLSNYQMLITDLSDTAYVQCRLRLGLVALRSHSVVEMRGRLLHQWAINRSVRACMGKAYSSWIYAYVRKSTLRLALESRIRKDKRTISTDAGKFLLVHKAADWVEDSAGLARTSRVDPHDKDVLELEASLQMLRAEAKERLIVQAEHDTVAAGKLLEDINNSIILQSSKESLTARALRLQKIKRSPHKIAKELDNLQVSSTKRREDSLANESADASFYYHKYLSRLADPNAANQSASAIRHPPFAASSIKKINKVTSYRTDTSTGSKHKKRGSKRVPRMDLSECSSDGDTLPHDNDYNNMMSPDMSPNTSPNMRDSSLVKLFKHAHTVQKSKAKSQYLENLSDRELEFSSAESIRKVKMGSAEKRISTSKVLRSPGRAGSDKPASVVLDPKNYFGLHNREQGSFASQRMLERSLEITARDAAFYVRQHHHSTEDESESVEDEGAVGAAAPIDCALKLIQEGRWALCKLKRNSTLAIAARKVEALDNAYQRVKSMMAWKEVFSHFQKVMALCKQVSETKARKKVVDWLFFQGVTRPQKAEKQVNALLVRNSLKKSLSIWTTIAHLTRARHLLVLKHNMLKLRKSMRTWIWCKSHIRGMTKIRNRVSRRVLYPVVILWRTKIKRIVKLKTVFKLCDLRWRLRWELMYVHYIGGHRRSIALFQQYRV